MLMLVREVFFTAIDYRVRLEWKQAAADDTELLDGIKVRPSWSRRCIQFTGC